MKYRWIWLFPAVYFPYHFLIAMRMLRSGKFGMMYENAAPPVLVSSGIVWLCGMITAIAWVAISLQERDPAKVMTRTGRIAFFAQIPAYLVYFQACFIFPFTIMTIPIKTFYLPVCGLALVPIILCAVAALAARRREKTQTMQQEDPHAPE
ncbi:MAG: hypothetical protein IKW92_08675 [Firmicutes bacterium]|nr:hypothetical protein [Bacillota bacterium]